MRVVRTCVPPCRAFVEARLAVEEPPVPFALDRGAWDGLLEVRRVVVALECATFFFCGNAMASTGKANGRASTADAASETADRKETLTSPL